jgi:hypothetical protein
MSGAIRACGVPTAIARIAIGSGEVRVHLHQDGGPSVDIRWFERFAGPANVLTSTKTGIVVPVEDLGEVIAALKQAEQVSRRERIGGRA